MPFTIILPSIVLFKVGHYDPFVPLLYITEHAPHEGESSKNFDRMKRKTVPRNEQRADARSALSSPCLVVGKSAKDEA